MKRLLIVTMAGLLAVFLSSCGLLPLDFLKSDDEQADGRMGQIAQAVDNHDAGALKELFSDRALELAPDIDQRLEYFLSFFPDGGLTWERQGGINSAVRYEDRKMTELLRATYKVSADGKDFRLTFQDFTVNDAIDPDNVGLYGLGAIPWTDDWESRAIDGLNSWASSNGIDDIGDYGYAGIYKPDDDLVYPNEMGDARMDQIANAVAERNADGLAGLFSRYSIDQATDFDDRLTALLAYLPKGNVTWERQVVNSDNILAGEGPKLLTAQYKVSVSGQEYWLFFADVVEDAQDSHRVGLAALAVSPWTEPDDPETDVDFNSWNDSWISESKGPYGIYVPGE